VAGPTETDDFIPYHIIQAESILVRDFVIYRTGLKMNKRGVCSQEAQAKGGVSAAAVEARQCLLEGPGLASLGWAAKGSPRQGPRRGAAAPDRLPTAMW